MTCSHCSNTKKAGFAALFGCPNTGKSSLMNAMLGERLSIVTPKAQTTRTRITGILTRENAQIVFVDTPGFLQPRSGLDHYMASEIDLAYNEVDVAVLVINPGDIFEIPRLSIPIILAVNKMDLAPEDFDPHVHRELIPEDLICPVSALKGTGIDDLVNSIVRLLPDSPYLYPEEQLSTHPERLIIAEMIRESIFLAAREEIPYGTAVIVDEFTERSSKLYIHAEIVVERESMKGIILGSKGRMIKNIGRKSRKRIEEFLQRPIFLDLKVKCRHKWRNKPHWLKELGYKKP